jgi:hypothetical protein
MKDRNLDHFFLVGGTALSLQIGHRKSIDIDLFTDKDFDAQKIAEHIKKTYQPDRLQTLKNGIFCLINEIKVDIIAHQYPLINPLEIVDGIRMTSLQDIGAMKLNAILYNGTRLKDFIDIHFMLEHTPLEQLTTAFVQKYPDVNPQMAHAALLYHEDISQKEKIQFVKQKISLHEIKERLKESVQNTQKRFQPKLNLNRTISESRKLIQKQSQNIRQEKGRGPKL